MPQAVVKLGEYEDRILTIVKGKFGFKNKSEAVNFVIEKYDEQFLEPQLKPEFVEKLSKLKKQKGLRFKSIDELKKSVENARV